MLIKIPEAITFTYEGSFAQGLGIPKERAFDIFKACNSVYGTMGQKVPELQKAVQIVKPQNAYEYLMVGCSFMIANYTYRELLQSRDWTINMLANTNAERYERIIRELSGAYTFNQVEQALTNAANYLILEERANKKSVFVN